jgi:uncharacterized protein with HEPN domain
MRSVRERLLDVLEAIERIEQRTGPGRDAFERDEMLQVWVLFHLQVLGEACRGIPQEFRDTHARVPWAAIIGMRNTLVHRYFGIDTDVVWSAVVGDLPGLKASVAAIVADLADDE